MLQPPITLEPLPDGRHRIHMAAAGARSGPFRTWVTAYPPELIREIHRAKGIYLCDEIMREEDPSYVEHSIRHEVLGYVEAAQFAGKRVLDFGCGSGASTVVLARLLPPCEIVGIELHERLLRIARLRASHFGCHDVRFLQSPSGDCLPAGLGSFDYVLFSAVHEHLLPHERRHLLPLIWSHLKPGGVLFLNQTPHRWSPIEWHTTGLPLINYLPDRLALHVARHFSRHPRPDASWEKLLRDGIRGGTIREVMAILAGCGSPRLLEPRRGDQIDLWYGKLSGRHAALKKVLRGLLKLLKPVAGAHLVPQLALAIRNVS